MIAWTVSDPQPLNASHVQKERKRFLDLKDLAYALINASLKTNSMMLIMSAKLVILIVLCALVH